MNSSSRFTFVALLALSPLCAADTITGRVLSSTGVPVSGVNIDAIRVSNGNDQDLANDGTTATGDFSTTIPPGVYDLRFFPPAPPASSHVTLVLRNVVVAGTKSLGTLTLPPGFLVSGRVQTQAGVPLPNVNIQVIDALTGNEVLLTVRKTNAFGNFNVAVPRNAIELRLDGSDILTPVVASSRLTLTPAANTNLGNLSLAPGFRVTGRVVRSANGLGVAGVDLDVSDSSGTTLYLPDDNTNSLGNFSVVVPQGLYDVEFCAPFAQRLVGETISGRAISSDQDLGILSLEPGFVLSGTIRSFSGLAQANADVDVEIQTPRAKVTTCSDNSNASGLYSIVVPAGNLRVTFRPPGFNLGLGSDVRSNVLVSADTLLDGSLPFCAAPVNYGAGLAGTGGFVPHLSSSGGVPANGNPAFAFELSGGRGGAFAALILSLQQRSLPSLGGTLLVSVSPAVSVRVLTTLGGTPGVAGAGSARVTPLLPIGLAAGFDLFAQFAVRDPLAPQGWALSDGLRFRVCQ